MKRSDLIFGALLVPMDFLMLTAAGLAAYFLRFQAFSEFRPVIYEIPSSQYLPYVFAVSLCTIIFFGLSGLYRIGVHRIHGEMQKIFSACSGGIMAVIIVIFFRKEFFSSRFIVLAAWVLAIIFVAVGRIILRYVRSQLFKKGIGLHPIAIIGEGRAVSEFQADTRLRTALGYSIVLTVKAFDDASRVQMSELVEKKHLDEIFVMDSSISHEEMRAILDYAQLNHIGVRYSADLIGGKNLEVGMVLGHPIVEIKKTKLDGWGKISKRAFDFFCALILSIILLPLFLLIAGVIRFNSRGPAIYKNIRVGQRGTFPTYKFRSMFIEYCTGPTYDPAGQADKIEERLAREYSVREGPVFKVLNDPRRTSIGRFLERTSLDELPQLWNVILGNMSLVGPRPHMPNQVAGYAVRHHQLFSVKPGITGLAQISGRSDLNFDDEAALDIFYVENWSFFFDFIILLKTPWAVIRRRSSA